MISKDFIFKGTPVYDYYLNFRMPSIYKKRDGNDIPLLFVDGYGYQYNWTIIQQEAIRYFQYWLDYRTDRYRKKFFRLVDFCCSYLEKITPYGSGWYYRYPKLPYFASDSPRISGMSQGQGISLLVKAYELTRDKKYLLLAEEVYSLMLTDIDNGGTRFVTSKDNWWFDERPFIGKPPTLTLNGFVYSLFGIADLCHASHDPKYLTAFQKGVAALKELLKSFDRYSWSLYNLYPNPHLSNDSYHLCHFNQLRALGYVAKDKAFLRMALKWEKQYHSYSIRNYVKAIRFFANMYSFYQRHGARKFITRAIKELSDR
jgi:hypothetical protein